MQLSRSNPVKLLNNLLIISWPPTPLIIVFFLLVKSLRECVKVRFLHCWLILKLNEIDFRKYLFLRNFKWAGSSFRFIACYFYFLSYWLLFLYGFYFTFRLLFLVKVSLSFDLKAILITFLDSNICVQLLEGFRLVKICHGGVLLPNWSFIKIHLRNIPSKWLLVVLSHLYPI